jgi:hypothetical protein
MDGGNAWPQYLGRDIRSPAATGSRTVPLLRGLGPAEIRHFFRPKRIDTVRHGFRFPMSTSAAVEANGGSNFPTAERHH